MPNRQVPLFVAPTRLVSIQHESIERPLSRVRAPNCQHQPVTVRQLTPLHAPNRRRPLFSLDCIGNLVVKSKQVKTVCT